MNLKKDIEDRADIERLMRRFYRRTLNDLVIGFIFTDIADFNLESHIPVITDFWETVLFSSHIYKGRNRAMDVHLELNEKIPLKKGHFNRWLFLFKKTVDEMYEGEVAKKAKQKADLIASGMQKRLGIGECSGVS